MTISAILNDGTYHFFSETILPNGRKFLYEKDMAISCNTPTSISIGNIGMEKINGKLPEKFDFVMSWLGGALYPLTVRIDNMGKAKEIVNIDKVRERYAAEGQRIMSKPQQSSNISRNVLKEHKTRKMSCDVLLKAISISWQQRVWTFPTASTDWLIFPLWAIFLPFAYL